MLVARVGEEVKARGQLQSLTCRSHDPDERWVSKGY